MTEQKATQFIEKLIDKTKAGDLSWEKNRSYPAITYKCKILDGCTVLLRYNNSSDLALFLEYTSGEAQVIKENYESFKIALARLYNIVYDLFPNPEKAIDAFLNS